MSLGSGTVALAGLSLAYGSSQCPPMMPGLNCQGGTYLTHDNVTSPEQCCELCSADEQCGAFVHGGVDNTCEVKRSCMHLKNDVSGGNMTAGLPEILPPAAAPTCVLPKQGQGYLCDAKAIATHKSSNTGDCCDRCAATDKCQMFSHQANTSTCHLFHSCSRKPQVDGWITGWAPPPQSDAQKYRVGRGSYNVKGYHCGNSTVTTIWYPKGAGPFNVVVYGHGQWGEIDENDDWLETMASLGLIIIAPFSGEQETYCGSPFVYDYLRALKKSKKHGAKLHPALATADWSRVGVVGQSMGAMFAIPAVVNNHSDPNITAVLMSGDVPKHLYSLDMPMMFTTGSLDKSNHNKTITEYFGNATSTHRIFANLRGAFHMEPQEGERLNLYTSLFLSCHVAQVDSACDLIYGDSSDSLCNANTYTDCVVIGDRPSFSTTTTGTTTTGTTAVSVVV